MRLLRVRRGRFRVGVSRGPRGARALVGVSSAVQRWGSAAGFSVARGGSSSSVWGCAVLTLVGCRDPGGLLWGWDLNGCCFEHVLLSLGRSAAVFSRSRSALFRAVLRRLQRGVGRDLGCVPFQWRNGRVNRSPVV